MSYYRGLDLYWARTWLRGREQFLVPITVEIYHLAEDQNEGLLPTPITEKLTGHISQGGSHGARIVFRAASGSSSPAMLPWGPRACNPKDVARALSFGSRPAGRERSSSLPDPSPRLKRSELTIGAGQVRS